MGKNYDNWERLVTAVLRRERDKETALNHLSRFDHDQSLVLRERSELPMDYSDLTPLDHRQWKTLMLPPDKQEVVWRSASLSFFLDQRTGKNCFLVGATKLTMASGDGSMNCWEHKYHLKSRFSEVTELIDSRNLYIEGNIETKMLSPETSYAAYLVFGFTEKYAKLHSAVSIIRNFYDELGYECPEEQPRIVHFQHGYGRADGRGEIRLGDFYVGLEDNGEWPHC